MVLNTNGNACDCYKQTTHYHLAFYFS